MKKCQIVSKTWVFASVLVAMMTFSAKSYAIFGLFGGGIPVIEALSTSSEIAKDVSVAITLGIAEIDRKMQEVANIRTALSFNYLSKFKLRLPIKPVAGAKILVVPSVADPLLEADVKKAIYKLFLKYPSHKIPVQVKYREESREFYDDSVLEAYSAAREVEVYLAGDVAAKFAELKKRLHGEDDSDSGEGGIGEDSGAENPDAKNEALYNNYLAYQTIDTIAAVIQEVTAIRSQLNAAKAIRDAVEPLEYKDNNQCDNSARGEVQLASVSLKSSYSISGGSSLAFAQASDPAFSLSGGGALAPKEPKSNNPKCGVATGKYQVNVDDDCYNEDEDMYNEAKQFPEYSVHNPDGDITFKKSEDPAIKHPYYDARYKINEMERLEFIYNKLTIAINTHNLIKKLRLAQEDFDNYKKMILLHEKAKRMLILVDKCAVTMLDNNFVSANVVWCGQASCSNIVENPEARSGISGWALNAYTLGKAAMSEEIEDINVKQMPIPTEEDIQSKKTENIEKQGVPYVEEHEDEILAAIDIGKAEEIARRGELLPWRIGAIAAKTLSENPGSWGAISNQYPVWNDQKNFYSQYLDGKYENLPIYLQYKSQAPVYIKALTAANKFLKEVGIKKTNDEADERVSDVRGDKKMSAADKRKKITEINTNRNDTIKQYNQDAVSNENAISKISGLSPSAIFPGLEKMNQKDVDVSQVDVFGQGSAVINIINSAPSAVLSMASVNSYALGITQTSMNVMKQMISAFRVSLCSLGDTLYYSADGAISGHQNLMKGIIAYEHVMTSGDITHKFLPFEGALNSLDITEDNKYFVGVRPLSDREAKAPLRPAQMGYAPLREIFHYDDVDRDNSMPGTAVAFLKHGGDIPEIWKVMLAPNPFVEKKLDLKKVLDSPTGLNIKLNGFILKPEQLFSLTQNAGLNTLVRGGSFPCNVTATLAEMENICMENILYNVERPYLSEEEKKDENCGATYFSDKVLGGIDNRKNTLESIIAYIQTPKSPHGGFVNPCVGITLNISAEDGKVLDHGDSKIEDLLGLKYYNERAGSGFLTIKDSPLLSLPTSRGRSELGIFFTADSEGNMKFRQSFLDLYKAVEELDVMELDVKKDILSNVPFQQNQIGAFLVAADKEQEYRKNRNEMAKAIAQLQADIAQALSDIGYQVAATFNLLKPEDSKFATEALEGLKAQMLAEIEQGIDKVKVSDNKVVKYRLREFKRMLMALQKDNEELVTIAEGVDGGPDFDEVIKMERANLAVYAEYRKQADEAFKEALRELSKVYCANYNEGAYDGGQCKFYK